MDMVNFKKGVWNGRTPTNGVGPIPVMPGAGLLWDEGLWWLAPVVAHVPPPHVINCVSSVRPFSWSPHAFPNSPLPIIQGEREVWWPSSGQHFPH